MDSSKDKINQSMRVVIYARVSSDRAGGRSVREQVAACRKRAAKRGWTVVAEFTDNDRSASEFATKDRPQYQQLVSFIRARGADVLMAWELSRLTREIGAYDELWKVCREAGVAWDVAGSHLDPSNSNDRMMTTILMAQAEKESAQTRERVMRALTSGAQLGRPHGPAPLGYRRVYDERTRGYLGQEINAEEAVHVREMFRQAAEGVSLVRLAAMMSERFPERKFDPTRIRRMIASPAYLGIRTHRGTDVAVDAWPALTDVETRDRALASVTLRAPVGSGKGSKRPVCLLVGIGMCARCQSPLKRSVQSVGRVARYVCANNCLNRNLPQVEAWVVEDVLWWLGTEQAQQAMHPPKQTEDVSELRTRHERVRQQLHELLNQTPDELGISGSAWARMVATLEKKMMGLAAEMNAAIPASVPQSARTLIEAGGTSNVDVRAVWEGLDLNEQREALRCLAIPIVFPPERKHSRRGVPRSEVLTVFKLAAWRSDTEWWTVLAERAATLGSNRQAWVEALGSGPVADPAMSAETLTRLGEVLSLSKFWSLRTDSA